MTWCRVCRREVTQRELIPFALSPACRHSAILCLMCAVQGSENTNKCPYKGCSEPVKPKSKIIQDLTQIVKKIYPQGFNVKINNFVQEGPTPEEFIQQTEIKLSAEITETTAVPARSEQNNIEEIKSAPEPEVTDSIDWDAPAPLAIEMLTGSRTNITVTLRHTVIRLKGIIFEATEIIVEKQKLVFDNRELVEYLDDGREARLGDLGIRANATILLIKILYSMSSNLSSTIFDLFWGYPAGRARDYLDASCIIFEGNNYTAVVDYQHRRFEDAIVHSGDVMDDNRRIGHHTINVELDKIPPSVTHLFFTLSAWDSPSIVHFPNPSLRFFDRNDHGKDLCSTNFSHAMNSEAVIMCSVSRSRGKWHIFESGKLSCGNARRYSPLVDTIHQLIKRGI